MPSEGRKSKSDIVPESHLMSEIRETSPQTFARHVIPVHAALDLGTNNCRMLIGTAQGDSFRVVDSFSRIVRLGEGLHHNGKLSDASMERAIEALHACSQRLSRRPVKSIRAVATEACRQAANGASFLARVQRETGLHFDIITAREEAALVLDSCAPLLGVGTRRALLFDIGGGSTELVWVRIDERGQPQLCGYVSLPVGVATLADRFGTSGFESAGFKAMMDDVIARLRPFEQVHHIGQEIRQGGVRLLGTSGTVTTLAGIVLALKQYSRPAVDGLILSRDAAMSALNELRAMGPEGLAEHPCVGPDRANFVLPGCAIFEAIQTLWPAPEVVVADRGLREGLLMRLIRADRARPVTRARIPVTPFAPSRD